MSGCRQASLVAHVAVWIGLTYAITRHNIWYACLPFESNEIDFHQIIRYTGSIINTPVMSKFQPVFKFPLTCSLWHEMNNVGPAVTFEIHIYKNIFYISLEYGSRPTAVLSVRSDMRSEHALPVRTHISQNHVRFQSEFVNTPLTA